MVRSWVIRGKGKREGHRRPFGTPIWGGRRKEFIQRVMARRRKKKPTCTPYKGGCQRRNPKTGLGKRGNGTRSVIEAGEKKTPRWGDEWETGGKDATSKDPTT